LRGKLGFHGVTITDSLQAGALRAFGGPDQRALLAVRAGDDLILCSAQHVDENSPSIGIEALDGIASGIVAHEVSRPEAEQAAARVLALRNEA
jgi:beta-N-acetylhexosaminidase